MLLLLQVWDTELFWVVGFVMAHNHVVVPLYAGVSTRHRTT